MSRTLRQFVRERAGYRCEYCQLPDFAAPGALFHLEHVVARQHGGSDEIDNRAWSCHRCNFSKGPNLSGRDPITGEIVRLFNPRRQSWKRHFEWLGATLLGRTRIGRATVAVLDINDPLRVELRQTLLDEGEWSMA
ncbi:MAG: HNH endonuclease [Gemmataceae bacterium]|nr:HNH endonuclease [Planctomycetia bacterium]MBX3400621.1 HNH endonuclease [Gemmataceae bacterium]